MIEIQKGDDNTYSFLLKTQDGNTLLNSISFQSEEEVEQTLAQLAPADTPQIVFERKTNHGGKFLFKLKDASGKVIGNSLLYGSEAGMENGIRNLRNRIASLGRS